MYTGGILIRSFRWCRLNCVLITGQGTVITSKAQMNPQLLLWSLVVISTALQLTEAQSCPSGCTGCETDAVDCSDAGLTSFPQLPVTVQQSVKTL